MIVKITPDFEKEYQELFDALSAEVSNTDGGETYAAIDSLPTYYRALEFLLQKLDDTQPNFKYIRLPLQENPIFVDWDKRQIEISSDFRSRGVGIQGDDMAEIIFFEADRFYGTTDLGGCECYIQWKIGNKTMNSLAFAKDYTEDIRDENLEVIEHGKILFGWIITKSMTENAGTVDFAIRLIQRDAEGKVTFSLNTEKASVPVRAGLNVDVTEASIEDVSSIVLSRPMYAGLIDSMDGASPIITDLWESGIVANLDEDGTYVMTINATSPDTGNADPGYNGEIVYKWYNKMAEIPDATGKSYTATTAGNYSARVGNYVPKIGTRYVNTPTILIPEAGAIAVDMEHTLTPAYAYAPVAEGETVAIGAESNDPVLKMTIAEPAQKNEASKIKYEWYKDYKGDGSDEAISTVTKKVYEEVEGKQVATGLVATYEPAANADGKYTCVATHLLNNTEFGPVVPYANAAQTVVKSVDVRKQPKPPVAVILVSNNDVAAPKLECNVTKHANGTGKFKYQWSRSDIGNIVAHGDGPVYDLTLVKTPNDSNIQSYEFRCTVTEVEFPVSEGVGVPAYSASVRSENAFNVVVSKDATTGALSYAVTEIK